MLGWDYLEKLSKQGVQQLQSTTATPKSIASGERAVMVDGNEYNMFIEINAKSPVKIIYPKEGTPFVNSPTAIFADAPHPNAARVLQNFLFTAKIQQLIVDEGGQRSVHPDVKEPADRTPLKDIKLLPDDPAAYAAADRRHQEALHGDLRQLAQTHGGSARARERAAGGGPSTGPPRFPSRWWCCWRCSCCCRCSGCW